MKLIVQIREFFFSPIDNNYDNDSLTKLGQIKKIFGCIFHLQKLNYH